MKKSSLSLAGFALALIMLTVPVQAAQSNLEKPPIAGIDSSKSVQPAQQNLKPGDKGYVGALNNRPSNAPAKTTSSPSGGAIVPNTVGNWYDFEPASINVLMRPNNDPSVPDDQSTPTTYDFGYYLQNVLPNEWLGSWSAETLKAGAVSVRSFGWNSNNNYKYPNYNCAVDNTTNSQVFKPNTTQSSTNTAVSATKGQAINYGTIQQGGYYLAGSYDSYRDSSSYNSANQAYQNGEHYWSDQGKSYTWMLSYYYPGTTIVTGSGY